MNKANVSLVAFYGDKPIELVNSIARLQEYLTNHQLLQGKFVPYQLEQVHGTIIGCEGFKTRCGNSRSAGLKQRRQETRLYRPDWLTQASSAANQNCL